VLQCHLRLHLPPVVTAIIRRQTQWTHNALVSVLNFHKIRQCTAELLSIQFEKFLFFFLDGSQSCVCRNVSHFSPNSPLSRQWNNTGSISKHRLSPYSAHYLNYNFLLSFRFQYHLRVTVTWANHRCSYTFTFRNNDHSKATGVENWSTFSHLTPPPPQPLPVKS